ncbi:CoxG family protein [Aquabacter spiritensis]|uniref:Carbon monoxide dehydrogenase subunit G n=1 Tax=Aquabacter spiritensis TaxID=933073 RepID=A0A4R3LSZ5_9HYPH|nr:SRPBCC family protein [Aquabacter spiritensis]TCT01735.1 carbon monoxide dehydrogenase subunit G [Aquabacter spiritensis]
MQIEQTFELPAPRPAVWAAMSDVRLVADCLPGAALLEELGEDRHKGSFKVKVGPLAATFVGEVEIARNPADWSAVVSGKGADARSASRVTGSMTYKLAQTDGGTRVHVVCTVNLAGALAQFGKAGIVQEIANRITAEFVRNFRDRLASAAPAAEAAPRGESPAVPQPAAPEPPSAERPHAASGHSHSDRAAPSGAARPLDGGSLFVAILRDRIAGFFRRLFGRGA